MAKLLKSRNIAPLVWTAPELLRMVVDGDLEDASPMECKQGDIYAYGVLLWELREMAQPWADECGAGKGRSFGVLLDAIIGGERPPLTRDIGGPREYEALIRMCWKGDPSVRPAFDYIEAALGTVLKSWNDAHVLVSSSRRGLKNKAIEYNGSTKLLGAL